MSKIADYFEQQEKKRLKAQEQREKETVADFAKELNKTAAVLMEQLREAGVQKTSETDRITETDKQVLLSFLQKNHAPEEPRKKITLTSEWESEEDKCLKAVGERENGAEWMCLEQFAGNVIGGAKIDQKFQAIVNLIVAKAVILEALPKKKLGRPKSPEVEDLGRELAQEYWDLRDTGTSYSEAVRHLAEKVHKDERHVMRLVEKHKKSVGLTLEERERYRQWAEIRKSAWRFLADSQRPTGSLASLLTAYVTPTPEFTGEDYIEYIDEQILKTVQPKNSTDIK